MKKLLSLALALAVLTALTFGQDAPGTVRFPGSLDSLDSLFRTADKSQTVLTSSLTSSSTSAVVGSTTLFPASGSLVIDNEIIYYTGKTSDTFTGLLRGQSGTAATAHASGALVRGPVIAAHHNTQSEAIRRAQEKIGPTGGGEQNTPLAGRFLRGSGAGTSAWSFLTSADIPALLDGRTLNNTTVTGTFNGLTASMIPTALRGSTLSGNSTINGDLNVAGVVSGNGAGLYGITGATGGVANTGSTTIQADSDNNASGKLSFLIGPVERFSIENDGGMPLLFQQLGRHQATGMKCDGVTNDSAALQAKGNEAIAAGKVLVIPAGVCKITSTVTFNATGKSLLWEGAGAGTTLLINTGTNADGLAFINLEKLRVYNLDIAGTLISNGADDARTGIIVSNVYHAWFDHVNVYGLATTTNGYNFYAVSSEVHWTNGGFFGCAANSGVGTSIMRHENFRGVYVNNAQFPDYGDKYLGHYSKTPFGSPVSWISVGSPINTSVYRAATKVSIHNVRGDEGAITPIQVNADPSLGGGFIQSVDISGVSINAGNVANVGISVNGALNARVSDSHIGYATNPADAISFADVGHMTIERVKTSGNARRLYVGTSNYTTSHLTVEDSDFGTFYSEQPLQMRVRSKHYERLLVASAATTYTWGSLQPTVTYEGQVKLINSGARPTCDATLRGRLWFAEGGVGVADESATCEKAADGSYAWVLAGGGGGGGATNLDDLGDVAISSHTAGRFLRADGSLFVDAVIAAADIPSGVDAAKVGDGSVSNAEYQRLDGVGSGIQGQLDAKAASSHTHGLADITDEGTAAALNVPATGDAASGEVVKGDDSRLTNARTPTGHTHAAADINSGTVATARLGSGTADSTSFLRGDSTWATVSSGPTINATNNRIPKRSSSAAFADSLLSDDGTDITSTARKFNFTGGTITTSNPVLDATSTWNAGGVTFTGLKFNVTDTASATASLLMDLQVGGSSRLSVRKDGAVITAGTYLSSQTNATLGSSSQSSSLSGLWRVDFASGQFIPSGNYIICLNNPCTTAIQQAGNGITRFLRDNSGSGGTYLSPQKTDTFGATMTVDLAQGNVHKITLTGNITSLTISNAQAGGEYTLVLVQDGTGSRTITWPGTVLWAGGSAPTLSGASKTDVLTFVSDGTNLYEKARALNQ